MKVLGECDGPLLSAFAFHGGDFLKAAEEIERTGLVVRGVHGSPVQSPFLLVAERATKQMRVIGGEFGLSSAARVRLQADASEPTSPRDPFEDYLEGHTNLRPGSRRAPDDDDDDEQLN
jgi:P27 family predicted phage terminase small subunit